MISEQASKELRDLEAKRRRWVEATRDNDFEEGIQRVLARLNPNDAHFIFELLQNAEDAEAQTVRFHLDKDRLRVTHDGIRLFTYSDVDAITSIANSKKVGDVNSIGEFGVGFKSVFSFTDSPQVHSGDYSFEIRDLVVPVQIPPIELLSKDTIFVFPLRTQEQPRHSLLDEISRGLRRMDHMALLFLTHISSIQWEIDGAESGEIVRSADAESPFLIRLSTSKETGPNKIVADEALYYCFHREMPGYGKLKCGFAIRTDGKKKMMEEAGRLCVFFPAASEDTGLRFHINGPYAASLDRASIKRDFEENKQIMRATAELLLDSLEQLRNDGLLPIDVTTILPNVEDVLNPFCEELRQLVFDGAKKRELVPIRNGGFAKADGVLIGDDGIPAHLTPSDVAFLSDEKERQWAAGTRDSRARRFLASVRVDAWGYKELLDAAEQKFEVYPSSKTGKDIGDDAASWLKSRTVDFLREFYLLLQRAARRLDKDPPWHLYKIVITKSKHIVIGEDAYFSNSDGLSSLDIETVRPTLLDRATKEDRTPLREFLEACGVSEVGEREKISAILHKYYFAGSCVNVAADLHRQHICRFIRWIEEIDDPSIFDGYSLLLGNGAEGFQSPDQLFLDLPLSKTGLHHLYLPTDGQDMRTRTPLWSGYVDILANMDRFTGFVGAVGAQTRLEITQTSVDGNPCQDALRADNRRAKQSSSGKDEDYTIEGLEELLDRQNIGVAQLIWETVADADSRVLHAFYQTKERTAPSSLVGILRLKEWIPAVDGKFYRPQEMTDDLLMPEFERNDGNGWLTEIGFGENATMASEERKSQEDHASALDLSLEEIKLLKDLREYPGELDKVRTTLNWRMNQETFPVRTSADSLRRDEKVSEQWEDAPVKLYERRPRSVRMSSVRAEAREWLKQEYTKSDGSLWCQICQQVMPFRRRDKEEYYFKIREVARLEKENPQQYIALCPLCAAKFTEFIKGDESAFEKLRSDLATRHYFKDTNRGELRIDIQLDKSEESILFTQCHLDDLAQFCAK